MRRIVIAVLAATLAACSPAPPAQREAAAPSPSPAIWRIADEDSEIWLFGTVHILPLTVDWRSDIVDAAFEGADELILETDVAPEGEGFAGLVARYGMLPQGQALSSLLSDEDRARLPRAAAASRLDPAALEPLRPWLAALQLSLGYAVANGHTPAAGVETVLTAQARANGKRISFLETPEQQIRALAGLPSADQMRFLSATLRQIEEEPDTMAAMDAAWARGDLEALTALFERDLSEAGPEVRAALLTRRNQAWTEEIVRRLEGDGDLFIAVGAAHLAGDDSVVALLRARGITVEGP